MNAPTKEALALLKAQDDRAVLERLREISGVKEDADFESKHPRSVRGRFDSKVVASKEVHRRQLNAIIHSIPPQFTKGLQIKVGATINGDAEYSPGRGIVLKAELLDTHRFSDYNAGIEYQKANPKARVSIAHTIGRTYGIDSKGDIGEEYAKHVVVHEVGHYVNDQLSESQLSFATKAFKNVSTPTVLAYHAYISDRQLGGTSNPIVERKLKREQFAEAFRQFILEGKYKKEFAALKPERRVATESFEESKHRRDREGKFAEKGGAGSSKVNPKVLAWAQKKWGSRKASDGSSIAQNFAEWFGDSKVVDKDGNPLVVYHGSRNVEPITAFRDSQGGSWFGAGVYLTTSPEQASLYAVHGDRSLNPDTAEAPGVIPVYVSLRRAFVMDDTSVEKESLRDITRALKENHSASMAKQFSDWSAKENRSGWDVWNFLESKQFNGATWTGGFARDVLAESGFDGLFAKHGDPAFDEIAHGADHVVAFNPAQIKSAIGNRGTFSRKSAKITEGL